MSTPVNGTRSGACRQGESPKYLAGRFGLGAGEKPTLQIGRSWKAVNVTGMFLGSAR
jgi:hypothetical protein